MKKKITALFLSISMLFGGVSLDKSVVGNTDINVPGTEKTKLKTPLFNLFSTTAWSLFLQEFEISLKIGFCGHGLDKAIGFKAHMIEPIGYFENTKKPLYFPFADLDLGGNIMKSGHTRGTITSEGGRDEFVWSHFIYVPIMGMIFKKKIPIFCFASGDLALPLVNEFLPPYSKDLTYKEMIAPMITMFTPQGLLSSIIDCSATTVSNSMHGFGDNYEDTTSDGQFETLETNQITKDDLDHKGEEYMNFIRNSMYYNVGCLGFTPVGGYIEGQDPGTDTELLLYQSVNLLHGASTLMPKPFLYKQVNFSGGTGKVSNAKIVDTMCEPKKYPLGIESQYVPQRAFPTVGDPHELGMTAIATTTAANVPGSKDSFVYVVWQRRDYYAFAYFCPGN